MWRMGEQTRIRRDVQADVVTGNIYRLMEDHEPKLSRADLYKGVGMASSSFYDKLDNRPEAFTVDELGRIAAVLGATIEDIVRGT